MSEERRLVTILFADVVGSTTLGEQLDPEDVRALLGRLFAIARDAVEAHGGRVEKFIGDAVMAVFGLPVAHDDDAAQALAAALDLRDRVRAEPALTGRIAIRLGVNGGEVIATRDADAQQFLVTGDAVNTAARLQQGAEPWQILVGERTAHAAATEFTFEIASAIEAKGKSAPVPARVLIGRAPARRERRRKLVGREDDLAQLELVARRTFAERRPYLVSILAPAGTGKTRLVEEFLDRLVARSGPTMPVVAITQCLPYGQRLTYGPLRSLLLRVLGASGDPTADEIRTAARAWLREAGITDPDRTADLLVATLGTAEIEGVDRGALFAAWRTLVETAAGKAPLVLVIEDLHWSSDSLLDLIEAILQPRGEAPLLMLVLARPELLDRRPTWGGGRRNAISLALEPLPDASVAALVADLLGTSLPEVAARIVTRAEGNPFYAGEIVRSIVERVPQLDDEAAVEAAIAALPDTVQATVLGRIDLLEPTARRALQVGSVFGRAFTIEGVAAVEPPLQGEEGAAIDQLLERDLVRPDRGEGYAFRHILIREVAYGTLPRSERSRLHAAAARWLEARSEGHADELAELIAYHYREAATVGSLMGTVPDDVRVSAVTWLGRAADAAMAAAANYEAARHLRAAIDLAGRDQLPELYERIGDVLVSGDEAIDAYEQALRLARQLDRPVDGQLGLIASHLLVWTRWHGSVASDASDDAERLTDEGEQLMAVATDKRQRARFRLATSFLPHLHHGETKPPDLERAVAAAREALELAKAIDDPDLQSAAYDALNSNAMEVDDYEGALAITLERLKLDDRLAIAERADARIVLGWANATLGRFEESLAGSTAALSLLGPGQSPNFALGATGWQLTVLHVLGRWDEALVACRRLHEAWLETDRTAAGFALGGWLAGIAVARARQDEALLSELRSGFDDIVGRFHEGSRPRRLVAVASADPEAIVTEVIEPWRLFTERMDQLDRALAICADRHAAVSPDILEPYIAYLDAHHIRLVAAQARRALGLTKGDPGLLRTALDEFEAMGCEPYAARAEVELGQLSGDERLYASGVIRLERLGDAEHLARLAATPRGRSRERDAASSGAT